MSAPHCRVHSSIVHLTHNRFSGAFTVLYLASIKNCSGVYEQTSIVNNVRVDDGTAELAIIASNASPSVLNKEGIFKKISKIC